VVHALKAGDRIIVEMDPGRFGLEVVNLLGERVALDWFVSWRLAKEMATVSAYKDRGRVWVCHCASRETLRPLQPTVHQGLPRFGDSNPTARPSLPS
jgi:hypothetical protein